MSTTTSRKLVNCFIDARGSVNMDVAYIFSVLELYQLFC